MVREILKAREIAVTFYKKYEVIFLFAIKFIVALFIFGLLFKTDSYRPEFAKIFDTALSAPFFLLMCLLFAISPPTLANALVVLVLLMQISASLIPAIFVGLLLILVLVLYCRLSPERSYFILAIILAYRFNMPYAVVIFGGLYFGLSCIVPITIGVLINSFIPFFRDLVMTQASTEKIDLVALPSVVLDTYKLIFEAFTQDFTWIFTAFIFALVVVAVYAISRLFTDYCSEIAVAVGSFICIVGFICANAFIGAKHNVLAVILLTIVSALIVELLHFFDIVLDFDRAERVQFEDEENYYYVKIVPKLSFLPAENESTEEEEEYYDKLESSFSGDTIRTMPVRPEAYAAAPAKSKPSLLEKNTQRTFTGADFPDDYDDIITRAVNREDINLLELDDNDTDL